MVKPLEVFTLGHGSRSQAELVGLLREFDVAIVADVRRFPSSSKHPHFSRANLERELSLCGRRYVWMGDQLGGFRSGGYAAYAQSPAFRRGVQEILRLAEEGRVVILCCERDPRGCHRRFIAAALAQRGVRVVHILGPGEKWEEPQVLSGAVDPPLDRE